MAKKTYLYILFILVTAAGCKEAPRSYISEKIAAKDLRDDFNYFRMILEAVHPGLYQYVPQKEMNFQFDSVYNSIKSDATVLEFSNKLAPIINSIHCGHTDYALPETYLDTAYKIRGYFPVPVNVVNHQLIVNSTDFEIPLGATITTINKEPIAKILPRLWKYESVDGFNTLYQQEEGGWDFAFNYFKENGPETHFKIGYKTDESEKNETIEIPAATYDKALSFQRYAALPEDVNYNMEMFDDEGYAVLTVYTFGYDTWSTDQAFENFIRNSFRLLQNTPAIRNLIIDLRNNTGGNFHNMFHLYGYLTNKSSWREFKSAYTVFNRIPFTPYLAKGENDVAGIQASLDSSFAAKKSGRFIKEYTDNETMYPSPYHFAGNVFVMTNTNVQSAAACFATLLKDEQRAKIVGSETGGSGSNTNSFHLLTYELPHTKIQLTVPIVHAEFSLTGSSQPKGHGVLPDYPVQLSLQDIKANNDPQLGFILDSLIHISP